jgi:hypothetical protein
VPERRPRVEYLVVDVGSNESAGNRRASEVGFEDKTSWALETIEALWTERVSALCPSE